MHRRRFGCRVKSSKARYRSLDDAWLYAAMLFGLFGHRLTPYLCSCAKSTCHRQRPACGDWHLTRKTGHVLPPARPQS